MRFLYVAPRFHPNQYPIIQGLKQKGNEVCFAVRHVGVTEHHGDIKVNVFSHSFFSNLRYKFFLKKGENYAESKMIFWFSPKRREVISLIKEYKPDVIILRERNLFSLKFYNVAKRLKVEKIFLYNQSPIYETIQKESVLKKIWKRFFPKTRITVCRYKEYPIKGKKYYKDENAFFLPFVPRINEKEKKCLPHDPIRILDMGKYREYKNHFLLAKAIKQVVEDGYKNIHVRIVGQASNEEEKQYKATLEDYVKENNLQDFISIEGSVPYDQVNQLLLDNDIFILTSSRELANVSILDSMSLGLATIATNKNGTSDYIIDGETGLIFESNNVESLVEKIEFYLNAPKNIELHGKNAKKHMELHFSFKNYYKEFIGVINSSSK